MIELLLGGKPKAAQPPYQDPAFLYDPETNSDLLGSKPTILRRANTTVDTNYLIDDHPTVRLGTANAGIQVTFQTPFNFNIPEWTIEWSSRIEAIGTYYFTELLFIASNGDFLGCRWTDGGYNSMLQMSVGSWANNNTNWRALTKTAVLGVLKRYALIYKDGVIRFYVDGVMQELMNGTAGTGAKQMFFVPPVNLVAYANMYIGYQGSVNGSYTGNVGRVRLSNYARYTGNYTPEPF